MTKGIGINASSRVCSSTANAQIIPLSVESVNALGQKIVHDLRAEQNESELGH